MSILDDWSNDRHIAYLKEENYRIRTELQRLFSHRCETCKQEAKTISEEVTASRALETKLPKNLTVEQIEWFEKVVKDRGPDFKQTLEVLERVKTLVSK